MRHPPPRGTKIAEGIDAILRFAQESYNPIGATPVGAGSTELLGGPNT